MNHKYNYHYDCDHETPPYTSFCYYDGWDENVREIGESPKIISIPRILEVLFMLRICKTEMGLA